MKNDDDDRRELSPAMTPEGDVSGKIINAGS